MGELILSVNPGSATLKFGLFRQADDGLREMMRGSAIGLADHGRISVRASNGEALFNDSWTVNGPAPDHVGALRRLLNWLQARISADELAAIGYRIPHGGEQYVGPAIVTPAVEADLRALAPLAPVHQSVGLSLLQEGREIFPDAVAVACFDTAFHSHMPDAARRLALPRELEATGLRRYGFHGLSYAHALKRLQDVDPELAPGRIVAAHLGSEASLCALDHGVSMDTTMGFSPTDGLVMATHVGAVDPSLILHLVKTRGLNLDAVEDILFRRSGLLAVAGESGDLRHLLDRKDQAAQAAVDLFVHRAVQGIGAMAATLRGLDGLVFTGGVGESSAEVRARICRCLDWLGVEIDAEANAGHGERRIDDKTSCVSVWVIPADEETEVARQIAGLIWPEVRAAARSAPQPSGDRSLDLLDEALEETFPASDPPSLVRPHSRGEL